MSEKKKMGTQNNVDTDLFVDFLLLYLFYKLLFTIILLTVIFIYTVKRKITKNRLT